ncbi:MAG TPA: hypothetical protein VFE77_06815 [Rhodanobacter sp.]|nr:hypothetical protein [Rhodanobacter sp.]
MFGYKDDPATGFHATAYKEVAPPHDIIIAYRGTDPDFKHHTITTAQDVFVDFVMVKNKVNLQEADARAFTQEVLDKAQALGISGDHITLVGHSLGGTLAEIEASEFGLRGMTLNAYGAVDLGYGVPEGGSQVTNYVMACDLISAASRHYGQTIPLASEDDLASLRAGRYLDMTSGAPAPNPLLAMRPGDHSIANFLPAPGKGDPLGAANLAQAEARYEKHRGSIDHFRGDLYSGRAGLALALNSAGSRNLRTTWANLPPQMQQQLAEWHVTMVDAPIQSAVAQARVVEDVKLALDQSGAVVHASGQRTQQAADEIAQRFRVAGQTMQRRAGDVSRGATAFMPIAPLAAGGVALGAAAAGHVADAEAEGYARASHLAGAAAHVGSQFVASQFETARHTVELGAQLAAQAAKEVVHTQESALVVAADLTINTYQRATHAYDVTHQAVSHGIDEAERAAGQAYDRLRHPGKWFDHAAPAQTGPASTPVHADDQAIPPTEAAHALNDPRHPDNPNHALYIELHQRIPDASENRLLQFTAACHANRITAGNLPTIHLDEPGMKLHFSGSSPMATPATVDLNTPPPQPRRAIQQIQQHDRQQVQMMGQIQAQNAQFNQQGLTPGGR